MPPSAEVRTSAPDELEPTTTQSVMLGHEMATGVTGEFAVIGRASDTQEAPPSRVERIVDSSTTQQAELVAHETGEDPP